MSHFYFESFKKAEFRTYFLCSHKFSEKMRISKNSLRGLVASVYSGGVGHGAKGIMGKKSKTAHLHLTFASFTSLVTP